MRALACCAAALCAFAALSTTVGRYSAKPERPEEFKGGGSLVHPAGPSVPLSRAAAKQMLVEDALAGRRTPGEVASLFRALDAVEPPARYPAGEPLDAAGYRLRVASYARVVVGPEGPAESAAAAERLRAEAVAAGGEALPDPAGLTPVGELLEEGVRHAERVRAEAAAREASPTVPPPA